LCEDGEFVCDECPTCGADQYMCDGVCHENSTWCDMQMDCRDGRDELACGTYILYNKGCINQLILFQRLFDTG